MDIKEKCSITGECHSTTPLKGTTTIELFDAKTGELVDKKVEHNMVTNYFQGPFSHELCGTYTNQPNDLFAQVKGVQLLNHAEDEDPSNVEADVTGSAVTGFGILSVNSEQTNTKWMSYNLLESGKTQTGYKWVWNANENQCNGPIECINLITNDLRYTYYTRYGNDSAYFNFTNLFHTIQTPLYLGKWCDTPANSNNTIFQTGMFSNIVHIDWKNDILYDIERNYDNDKIITIKKYNLNRTKINLRYRLKPTLIEEHSITFQNSLNHDYTASASSVHARSFAVKVEGNYMYLVKSGEATYKANTNKLRIIKINLTDYSFTDNVYTLTVTYVDQYKPMLNSADKTRNFHFIKDFFPIHNGYIYLCGTNAAQTYKVNLNDVSDIEVIDTTGGYNATQNMYMPSIVTNQNVCLGQRISASSSHNNCTFISLKDGKVAPFTNISSSFYIVAEGNPYGRYSGTAQYINNSNVVFYDITDGIMTLAQYTRYNSNDSSSYAYSGMIYMGQYEMNSCMVTINNVSPVVKTSDKTMKVTYELSESTE